MQATLSTVALLVLLAIAWTPSCAGRVPYPPPAPPSSAVPEGATWCNARPRFANGTARILPELAQAQAALGLNIIRFPSPASFEDWTANASSILQTCKFVAYAPFFADGLGSQYGRIIKIAAWAATHGVTYVHMPPEHIDHGVDPLELDRFFNIGEGEITPMQLPRGATVCLVDHCGPSTVQMAYMETAVAKMLHGSVSTMQPLPTYNHQRINIGIHIRRGDVTETPRYLADGRWVPDVFYVNLIRNLTRDLVLNDSPQFDFHIYSLGDPQLFANITSGLVEPAWSEWWLQQPPPAPSPPTLPLPWLTASGSASIATQFRNPSTSTYSRNLMGVPPPPNTIWHLKDSEIDTVRGLICADIMVKAPGSLSAVSSWYSGAGVHITGGYPWNPQKHLEANYLPAMVGLLKQRLKARRFNRVGC